jgi:hypothetical protein
VAAILTEEGIARPPYERSLGEQREIATRRSAG